MEQLDVNRYYLQIGHSSVTADGDYVVEVHCESDDDWEVVMDLVDAASPVNVVIAVLVVTANLFL